jgi:hypothetical protein
MNVFMSACLRRFRGEHPAGIRGMDRPAGFAAVGECGYSIWCLVDRTGCGCRPAAFVSAGSADATRGDSKPHCNSSVAMLHRRKARATDVSDRFAAFVEESLARLGTQRNVRVAVVDDAVSPMLAGPFRPSILLPAPLLAAMHDAEIEQICLHEAAHLARYDDWALLAQRLIETVFALHPLARWISRQIHLEREIACDDAVITLTGLARPYAACLTHAAELAAGVIWMGLLSAKTPPLFALAAPQNTILRAVTQRPAPVLLAQPEYAKGPRWPRPGGGAVRERKSIAARWRACRYRAIGEVGERQSCARDHLPAADPTVPWTENEYHQTVLDAGVPVFTNSVIESADASKGAAAPSPSATLLGLIVNATGGREYPRITPLDVPSIVERIGIEAANQYALGYIPSAPPGSGKYSKLEIRLNEPRGLPRLTAWVRAGRYGPVQ